MWEQHVAAAAEGVGSKSALKVSTRKQTSHRRGLGSSLHIIRLPQRSFRSPDVNEGAVRNLSSGHPQRSVHNLLIKFAVGEVQRREIKQRRGFHPGRFGYN